MSHPVKTFDSIVSDMVAYIIENAPAITDFNPGSIIRSFCEAAGLVIEEVYVAIFLGFQRQLSKIPQFVFNFKLKEGTYATTSVVFSRAGAAGQDFPINASQRIQTTSGLIFATTASGVIASGQTSSSAIEAVAVDIGYAYNVGAGTLTAIIGSINGVNSVTNANAATGGTDAETTYQYNKRFQAYIEGLGRSNIAGMIYGALSVQGITSASIVEHFPATSNINAHLYVDDGHVSGVSSELLAEVQSVINGDGTSNNPGYRAAGVNVVAAAPTVTSVTVTASISILPTGDQAVIISDIKESITNYINNLGVATNVVYNEIIAKIMNVYGVVNCVLTAPAADITIASSHVGRVGTITITVTA
jgi:uncharacterized phage protein gp47/JayE